MGRSEACRTVLYELHNGERTASGRHLQKYTAINEYAVAGYAYIGKEIFGQPISRVSVTLESLEEKEFVIVQDMKQDESAHARHLYYDYGVRKAIQFLIKTPNDHVLGMVEVHYPEIECVINEETAIELQPTVNKIASLLSKTEESASLWKFLLELTGKK